MISRWTPKGATLTTSSSWEQRSWDWGESSSAQYCIYFWTKQYIRKVWLLSHDTPFPWQCGLATWAGSGSVVASRGTPSAPGHWNENETEMICSVTRCVSVTVHKNWEVLLTRHCLYHPCTQSVSVAAHLPQKAVHTPHPTAAESSCLAQLNGSYTIEILHLKHL